jgi:Protein of unknown function (DUF3223)
MNITLGDRQFPSKAAALRYIKHLRLTHRLDVPLGDPYHAQVCDLISHHPGCDEKVGAGIDHFTVSLSPWGNREFHLHRVDGTSVNFSYTKCLEPKAPALREAKLAMRREVQDEISAAKWQWWEAHADVSGFIICPVSGDVVTGDGTDADHAPPYTFDVLATTFLTAHEIEPDENFVVQPDGKYLMADRDLSARWRRFHHKLAHLRVISSKANRAVHMARPEDRQLKLAA